MGEEWGEGPPEEQDEKGCEQGLTDPMILRTQFLDQAAGETRTTPRYAYVLCHTPLMAIAWPSYPMGLSIHGHRVCPKPNLMHSYFIPCLQGYHLHAVRHLGFTYRGEHEAQITEGLITGLMHAMGYLSEDSMNILHDNPKGKNLPTLSEHRYLQKGSSSKGMA